MTTPDIQLLQEGLDSPGEHAAAVDVSSVDVTLTHASRAFWVGTAGDLKVDTVGGEIGQVFASATGWMPIRATKVYHAGTTASGITAVW